MRSTTFLAFVFLGALLIRIGFTVSYRGGIDTVPVQSIAGSDGVEYDELGRSLAAGNGYAWENGTRTSFRAPGFPIWLACLYSLAGVNYGLAYCSFAVLGGLGAIATYLLGCELAGERVGRFSAILAMLYPGDIFACSYFFSESLFAPCLGFGLWFILRYVRSGGYTNLFFAGILLGYAALTRSFGILFLPIFVVYLLGRPISFRSARCAGLFGLGFLCVIAPWTYRNFEVHHKFVLIATNGGSTFYGANNELVAASPREYGNWVSTTRLAGRDQIDAQPDEVAHDKMEWKLGVDWVKGNPDKFAILAPFKILRFWSPFVQWPSLKTYPVANIVSTTPFLVLIGIGIFRSLRGGEQSKFAVLHLTLLANLAMVLIFWGDPRFRDANVPVLMVYAALGAGWLQHRMRRPKLQGELHTDFPDPVT